MKKDILLVLLSIAVLLTGTLLLSDGLTYLTAGLMATLVMGLIRANRAGIMKITKWAKTNPKKAQWLIAGIQLSLMGLGIIAGNNLKELGYQFSDTTAYVFTVLMAVSFISIPFLPKQNTLIIPRKLNEQRLAYLGVTLSSLILMAFVGNKIGEIYPNALLTQAIEKTDQFIFANRFLNNIEKEESTKLHGYHKNYNSALNDGSLPEAVFVVAPRRSEIKVDSLKYSDPTLKHLDLNKAPASRKELRKVKQELRKKYRQAATAGMCALAILLIILLLGTTCAGVCLFIFGVSGEIGVAGIILGPVIAILSVVGIVRAARWCRRNGP